MALTQAIGACASARAGRVRPDGDHLQPCIDWIPTRGALTVRRAELATDAPGGQFPSDRFPVTVCLSLPPAPPGP